MIDKALHALFVLSALTIGVAGCRTVPTDQDEAAHIIHPGDASRAALQRAVSDALHAKVTLADGALTETSLLIIERSPTPDMQGLPAQGRNMDVPIQFRLVINGEDCILIDQRDQSRRKLDNTRCTPE